MKNWEIALIGVSIVSILGALILIAFVPYSTNSNLNVAQILLTFSLVLVTCIYTVRTKDIAEATRQQASASIKMAEEMKEQRYDSVRPLLDIEVLPKALELAKIAYGKNENELASQNIICRLHNVGIGPAIDVFSKVAYEGNITDYPWGIITVGVDSKEKGFALVKKDNEYLVIVKYKDLYNRDFESMRRVITSSLKFDIGNLETNIIKNKT